MSKKNPVLGAVLGLFILGLYYSTGFNKRAMFIVAGLIIASYGLMFLVSPDVIFVVHLASAFLGYKWCKEHNESLEAATGHDSSASAQY